MLSILSLGFLIGMQHALEADHVAAVSSLVAGKKSLRSIARHGAAWGSGHALMLLVVGGGALLLGRSVPENFATWIEFAVSIMLIGLGGHLLYRLWRDRIHFHSHRHDGDTVHFHAHSHRGETGPHDASSHHHDHPEGLPLRTFAVGLMHGMAGSAALVVLTASAIASPLAGLLYIVLFGAGSILGMWALSLVIAVPLSFTARFLTLANNSLQVAIGLITIAVGGWLMHGTGIITF